MQWIEDIHNWKRFRSVQFGMLASAFMAPLTFYGACLSISPSLVSGIPHWFLTLCASGGMLSSGLALFYRAIKQNNLPDAPTKTRAKTNAGMSTQ